MSENEKNEQLDQVDAAAKAKKDKSAKPAEKKPGIFQRIGKWFKEMRSELKKVQWPGAKSVGKNTLTVIICVVVVGVFIWVFDALATAVVDALLALFKG